LKVLAEKAGVELRRVSPQEYKQFGLLYDINAAAKEFFLANLERGDAAREYLQGRKLTRETAAEFEIGWASNEKDALAVHLVNIGFDPADILRAGLTFKTDKGMVVDRFRGRIMFPIHNHLGKVVGFTGRILPQFDNGEMGKYINSPETAIFQKSKLLYGFWKSKNPIRDADSAFLVEGQMDFLMTWQSGMQNVIATSGTALTAEHLRALRRSTDRLILSFDSDEAGLNALERAIDLAESQDFGVKVARLDEHKDPADAVVADPGFLKKAVAAAVPAPQFYFDRYLPSKTDLRDRDHLAKLRLVLGKLNRMASSVERELWMKDLAARAGVALETLEREASGLAEPKAAGEAEKDAARETAQTTGLVERKLSRRELLAEHFLAALATAGDFTSDEDVIFYLPEAYREVFEVLKRGERKSADPLVDERLNAILLVGEDLPIKERVELKEQIRRAYLRERREELAAEVRRAEQSGDEEKLQKAMKDLAELPSK
jgi:DNA primase